MTQEVLKLALEALETELSIDWTNNDEFNASAEKMYEAITAIKEALAKEKTLQALHDENKRLGLYKDAYAQPEQEPVDYEKLAELGWQSIECPFCGSAGAQAFPQRTWVGLTDEEFDDLRDNNFGVSPLISAVEAKLKEKNSA